MKVKLMGHRGTSPATHYVPHDKDSTALCGATCHALRGYASTDPEGGVSRPGEELRVCPNCVREAARA